MRNAAMRILNLLYTFLNLQVCNIFIKQNWCTGAKISLGDPERSKFQVHSTFINKISVTQLREKYNLNGNTLNLVLKTQITN